MRREYSEAVRTDMKLCVEKEVEEKDQRRNG